MSVASLLHPFIEYTTTALSAQADNSVGIVLNKILPAGSWLITGSVAVTADAGANIPTLLVYTDVRYLSRSISATGPTSAIVPVSFLYLSDGVTPLQLKVQADTSAGGTWSSVSTIVDVYKLP
jgi:hypothetical protein